MEINGTIYKILPQEEVTFNDGTKKVKGGFVIMREGDYPKPVYFEMFGEERLAMLNGLTIGMPVRVSFYAESRESKGGKFYTTLRCTNVMQLVSTSNVPPTAGETTPVSAPPAYSWNPNGSPVPTQNQEPTDPPQENDLPWDGDQVPF